MRCGIVRYIPCHEISGWGSTQTRVLLVVFRASNSEMCLIFIKILNWKMDTLSDGKLPD